MISLQNKRQLTQRERLMREYYIKCFLSEFNKICIFFVIFACLHLTIEYLFALLFLMLFRTNGGGLHFNHYTTCLFVSFSFLYASIFLAIHIVPANILLYISTIVCGFLGYYFVPITSNNRPPANDTQIQKAKRTTVKLILVFFILICFCPHNRYVLIGYWTMILHIFQLLIARMKKEVTAHV